MNLDGKRVLFIAPMFFGYEKLIKNELESLGAQVEYFNDRPDNSFLTKALIRVDRRLLAYKTNRYYDTIIDATRRNTYDYVLIVRGEAISLKRLSKLKQTQPKAKFKLYLWDSMHYNPNARSILSKFDNVFSFDRTDSNKYSNVTFLPLFYGREFERAALINTTPLYDACFIGTIHTDRYKVLEKILNNIESQGRRVYVYCYYPSKLLAKIRSIFDPGFRKFAKKNILFSGIPLSQVIDRIAESGAIIDVNRPSQRGLTMRSIEAIGAQRPLITTNEDIVNYDIYSPSSVFIVDRENPVVNYLSYKKQNDPYDQAVREQYSVTAWLSTIFD